MTDALFLANHVGFPYWRWRLLISQIFSVFSRGSPIISDRQKKTKKMRKPLVVQLKCRFFDDDRCPCFIACGLIELHHQERGMFWLLCVEQLRSTINTLQKTLFVFAFRHVANLAMMVGCRSVEISLFSLDSPINSRDLLLFPNTAR